MHVNVLTSLHHFDYVGYECSYFKGQHLVLLVPLSFFWISLFYLIVEIKFTVYTYEKQLLTQFFTRNRIQ